MNAYGSRTNVAAIVGIVCSIVLAVAFFLPWFSDSAGATASPLLLAIAGLVGGGVAVKGAGLLILIGLTNALILVGTVMALCAAIYRAARSYAGRSSAWLVIAGFGITLASAGLSAVILLAVGDISPSYGLFLGLVAAIVGLGSALTDLSMSQATPGYGTQWPVAAPVPPAAGIWAGPTVVQPQAGGAWAAVPGRLTMAEAGRTSTVTVSEGQQVMVGRDAAAQVRLSDPRVSRRHALIIRSEGGWVVRDLGATNPTRVVSPSGATQTLRGETRMASGQLQMGQALITLYPS